MFTREDRRDAISTLSALADNCEDAIAELARYARYMSEDDAEATQHSRALMKIAADEFEMARRSLVMAKKHLPSLDATPMSPAGASLFELMRDVQRASYRESFGA